MNKLSLLAHKLNEFRSRSRSENIAAILHQLHLLWCLISAQDRKCPYCENPGTTRFGKEALITEVRFCPNCHLRFRWPKDSARFNRFFYQWAYEESNATDLPDPSLLTAMRNEQFVGTPFDHSPKIAVLKSIRPSGRILDFGTSWGYMTYQLGINKYDSIGFELSKPRAHYGRTHLGVEIIDDIEPLSRQSGTFDIIFTSHVLEHVPNPRPTIDLMYQLLRKGGALVCFVPNCDGLNAREQGMKWGALYGMKHVLSLDKDFFARALPQHGFSSPLFFTDPYDPKLVAQMIADNRGCIDLPGDELMVYAVKGL